MLIRITDKECGIFYDGKIYTAEDPAFECNDRIAQELIDKGQAEPAGGAMIPPESGMLQAGSAPIDDPDLWLKGPDKVEGMTKQFRDVLIKNGYTSLEEIFDAKIKDLIQLKGLGKKNAVVIYDAVQSMFVEEDVQE